MSPVPEVHIDQYLGASPLPEIDDEGRANAEQVPNGTIGYYDPVPTEGKPNDPLRLQGFRAVGPDGTFTGAEWRNADYVPHPETAGTKFDTEFELQLWRTVKGYLKLGRFVRALHGAELFARCTENRELNVRTNEWGDATLDVYTSITRLPRSWPHWESMRGADLLNSLGRAGAHLGIQFNPKLWPGLRMPAQTLTELWDAEQARVTGVMRVGPLPTTPTTMGSVTAGGQR